MRHTSRAWRPKAGSSTCRSFTRAGAPQPAQRRRLRISTCTRMGVLAPPSTTRRRDRAGADSGVARRHRRGRRTGLAASAMAHLNLAMIHPFSDGSGRMARCLQILVLAREKILTPEFTSIEKYLGHYTQAYFDVLAEGGGGSWQPHTDARPWVRFCLTAHYRQARTMLRRVEEPEQLWDAPARPPAEGVRAERRRTVRGGARASRPQRHLSGHRGIVRGRPNHRGNRQPPSECARCGAAPHSHRRTTWPGLRGHGRRSP